MRQAKGHSRFDHRRMDGVTVPIDQPFVTPAGSRLRFPGDRSLGAPAGEVVNCRCTIVGVVLEPLSSYMDQGAESAPPARPRPITWTPQKRPLNDFLYMPRQGSQTRSPVFETVQEGAEIVSRVHGVDGLIPIHVAHHKLDIDVKAQYGRADNVALLDVEEGKTDLIHVLEEFGHWIDDLAFTSPGYESLRAANPDSNPASPLAAWWRAVDRSVAVAELRSQRRAFATFSDGMFVRNNRGYVKYLLEPEELFARSYRQFVAVHSGDPRLLKAIGNRQNTPGYEIGYNIQWNDDDFEPIAQALEDVFWRLGWLRR